MQIRVSWVLPFKTVTVLNLNCFIWFYIIVVNGNLDRAVAQHRFSMTQILKLSNRLVQILATLNLEMSYLRPTVSVFLEKLYVKSTLYDNTVSCKMLKIGSNIRIVRLNRNQHGQVDFSRLDCNKWVLIFLIYLQNTWWLFLSTENLLYQIKKKDYRDALVHKPIV